MFPCGREMHDLTVNEEKLADAVSHKVRKHFMAEN